MHVVLKIMMCSLSLAWTYLHENHQVHVAAHVCLPVIMFSPPASAGAWPTWTACGAPWAVSKILRNIIVYNKRKVSGLG